MSFLLLDGWRLPAFNETPQQTFEQHGEITANWMNKPVRNRRALPSVWQAQMAVMLAEDATTLEGLLMGQGHHFPCDAHAFSESGIGPEAGGGYSILNRTSTNGMFGLGYLSVSSNIVWDAKLIDDSWTVAYWRAVTGTPVHVVVRADGAKFINGVRDDTAATTELTVDLGAVALTAGAYDDVVILSFNASDSFTEAFYRWTTGKMIQWHVPFDGDDDEALARGVALVSSVGASYVRGQIGNARRFVAGSSAQYSGTKTNAFGATELSWECWFIRRSALVEGSPTAYILDKVSGAAGYSIFINTSGLFAERLDARLWTAAGQLQTVLDVGTTPKDVWHHLVVTWTQASGALTTYLNGVSVGTVFFSAPGSPTANDGAANVYVGNNTAASRQLGGDVDDMRMYRLALTPNEVVDHFNAGRHGIAPPVLQPCSKLPSLEIDGGIVGWRQTNVLGDAGDAGVIQHGSSDGWKNNSRQPQATLEERSEFEPSGYLHKPDIGLTLSEKFDVSGTMRHSQGNFSDASRSNGVFGPGPFGFGRAWYPQGPPTGQLNMTGGTAQSFGGKQALTVLAWVRRTAIGAQHTVLVHERAGASIKVRLDVTAGNLVRFGGRASAADAAEVLRSSVATLVDTASWHLIGGVIDLQNNRLATVLDTAYDEGAATFATTVFTTEAGAVQRVGVDNAVANRWTGGISHVFWWHRRLTRGEILAVLKAGKAGQFR